MKRRSAVFWISIALGILPIFLVYWGIHSLVNGMCDNTTIKEANSPDGQWKAVIFTRGCGATTADSQQISILGSGETLPDDGGNVFIQQDEISNPDIKWLSATQLQITASNYKVFKQEKKWGTVTISYLPNPNF